MLILYFDTRGENDKVLIARDGIVLDEISLPPKKHTEELLGTVDFLLKKHQIAENEVGAVAVRSDNGSYTGIRVGITIANFLAFSWNIPVLSVTSDNLKTLSPVRKNFLKPVDPSYKTEPKITKSKSRLSFPALI